MTPTNFHWHCPRSNQIGLPPYTHNAPVLDDWNSKLRRPLNTSINSDFESVERSMVKMGQLLSWSSYFFAWTLITGWLIKSPLISMEVLRERIGLDIARKTKEPSVGGAEFKFRTFVMTTTMTARDVQELRNFGLLCFSMWGEQTNDKLCSSLGFPMLVRWKLNWKRMAAKSGWNVWTLSLLGSVWFVLMLEQG